MPQFTTRPAEVPPEALHIRQRLLNERRLWVDPFTAGFLARAAAGKEQDVAFIAADARTGRSDFHRIATSALREDPAAPAPLVG